jgi:hypothetical protein
MRITLIGLIVLLCSIAAQAQGPWPQERPDDREMPVLNEDGGHAYIVRPTSTPLVGLVKPGATNVSDLQQYSIFLGPGWADPSTRAKEPKLSKLLSSIRDHAQMDEISQAGITNLFGPTWSVEKLDIAGDRNISDLEIQRTLAEMLKSGGRPNSDALYIVYLDPSLHSTLASLSADKHYVAYHGYFYTSGARVHYAVVPFESDSQAAYQTALRALIVAALHEDNSAH